MPRDRNHGDNAERFPEEGPHCRTQDTANLVIGTSIRGTLISKTQHSNPKPDKSLYSRPVNGPRSFREHPHPKSSLPSRILVATCTGCMHNETRRGLTLKSLLGLTIWGCAEKGGCRVPRHKPSVTYPLKRQPVTYPLSRSLHVFRRTRIFGYVAKTSLCYIPYVTGYVTGVGHGPVTSQLFWHVPI